MFRGEREGGLAFRCIGVGARWRIALTHLPRFAPLPERLQIQRRPDRPTSQAFIGMTTTAETERAEHGTVIASVVLALLESVRAHDRPGEVLEDEDLAVSLPRRFGLKGVVLSQIERYEKDHAAGRKLPVGDVSNLLQLVLRRPDAEAILRDAGRRIARFQHERLSLVSASLLRVLPRSLELMRARRAARRLLRGTAGSQGPGTCQKPFVVQLPGSVAARLDPIGCVLYTGALEELILLYTGSPRTLLHERCTARGEDICEWVLAD